MKKGKSVFVSLVLACVILASPIVSASENQFYMDYLAGTEAEKPVSSYEISAESYAQKSEAAAVKEVYGENAVYLEHAGDFAEYTIQIQQAGFYHISLRYALLAEHSEKIKIGIQIDGETPFLLADDISLGQEFQNKVSEFEQDKKGNQIAPDQVIAEKYTDYTLRGDDYTTEGYYFNLPQGTHTIRFVLNDGVLPLQSIKFYNEEPLTSYTNPSQTTSEAYQIFLEGEKASRKSHASLYPTSDRSSPATSPSDSMAVLLNTIGGDSTFQKNHQWLEWDFEVENTGYYNLLLRFRQNVAVGMTSYRRIYIDGQVLGTELDAYQFGYSTKWQLETLKNETEDLRFYLEKGKHTIRLEVVPGETEYTVGVLEKEIKALNEIYQQILFITGPTPDTSRDYFLEEQIPGLLADFSASATVLRQEYDRVMAQNDGLGSSVTFMKTFALFLDSLVKEPDTIASRLYTFKSNIATLSSLQWSLQDNPLEIDYLVFQTQGQEAPKANAGFWESLVYEVKRFFISFFNDYGIIGDVDENAVVLEVWTTAGREQAQIMKNLITNHYSQQSNVSIKLSLLPGSSLIEPIMAHKGPDVVIGVGRNIAVNLAARQAVVAFDDFEGFDEIMDRFAENASVPYQYNGKTYGIPELQDFNLCFVRNDVFQKLGLEVPQTWDDLKTILPTIVQNNLEVGIPNGIQAGVTAGMEGTMPTVLPALVMQNGLDYYSEDLTETVFSSKAGVKVFEEFTKLFTDYSCTVYFNATNRFRTGETPFMIAPLSTYAALRLTAPEINGLWSMYPMLGTEKADGTIDRTVEDTGSASIIIADSQYHQEAYDFLEWWSQAQTQAEFAESLENMLGISARYLSANLEAFSQLDFSEEEHALIAQQREWVNPIPELPATYIVTRNLSNSFLSVVNDGRNPVDSITQYARIMKDELTRKKEQLDRLDQD